MNTSGVIFLFYWEVKNLFKVMQQGIMAGGQSGLLIINFVLFLLYFAIRAGEVVIDLFKLWNQMAIGF